MLPYTRKVKNMIDNVNAKVKKINPDVKVPVYLGYETRFGVDQNKNTKILQ
jgi:hypothetical protein